MSADAHKSGFRGRALLAGWKRYGFTLVELLAVIAIMILLMAWAIPAMKDISGGINITATSEQVLATISLARQRATAFNRNVSIRFFTAGSVSGTPYLSYQLWEQPDLTNAGSWRAVDKEQKLGLGIMISPDATFSSILTLAQGTDANGRIYAEVFFTPNGSITAPSAKSCLTIHSLTAPKTGGRVAGLPANFVVICIEPFNGSPRAFRP